MKIFIGSSTESLESVRVLAIWIEEFGFTPIPWDSPSLFLPGENTFSKLIEISKTYDAAIFLFAEDDKIWYRQDALVSQPRDNVLIEYGLFVGTMGQNKTIICKQGDTKIASDLSSIVFADLSKVHKARVQINAWLNKLKTLPEVENQIFQKRIEKEIFKREIESIKQELEFEKAKSTELQNVISNSGMIDFFEYDLNTDAHWKLLFDYEYFWTIVSLLNSKFGSVNNWKNEIERQKTHIPISWEYTETWTKIAIAKCLRWFRKYNSAEIFQKFLTSIQDVELQNEINEIASTIILKLEKNKND